MNDLLLTAAERHRFADWLEHEARTDAQLLKQMETIGTPGIVLTHRRAEIAAAMLVVRKLRSIEDASIG